MDETVLAIWDAICRRELGKALDDCAPTMVKASTVTGSLYAFTQELGARETTQQPMLDEVTELVILKAIENFCRSNTIGAMTILRAEVRDTLREYVRTVLIKLMLMETSDLDYGPVPTGLRERGLALAAIAFEILQTRDPQLTLLQRRNALH